MHWLSASPNSLKGRAEMHAAQCGVDIEQLPEKKQAADDWRKILKARARELKPGGRLVLVNFCVSKEGYFLGQTEKGVSMWGSFSKSWQKLFDDGLIDETELTGVSFPNYYRTTAEFLEGVRQVPSLKVISSEENVVPCPYREQWRAGKAASLGIESPRQYAEWFVPTTRTWSHSTFASALRTDRSKAQKDAILKQFWQNYVLLVAQDPDSHGMDYVHNYLVLEKY
jgi:SAM dependent carboxyl methyltransferase